MKPKKQYSDPSGVIYNIGQVNPSHIREHCSAYLKILDTTLHRSEEDDLYNKMQEAAQSGVAVTISIDDIEVGYIYALYVGKLRLNIIAVNSPIYKAGAVLVDYIYSLASINRFTPKGMSFEPLVPYLSDISVSVYKSCRTESIRMKPPEWNTTIMNFLNITEVK